MSDVKAKIKKNISDEDIKNLNDEDLHSGVYLFFSFDLVNSTYFKSRFREKWQKMFTRFYDFVEERLKEEIENVQLWKYIGDEVLFYLKLTDLNQLFDAPYHAINIIEEVTQEIYKVVPVAERIIYIKGTIWIADVKFQTRRDIAQESKSVDSNIIFFTGNAPEWLSTSQNIDFLGPEIDLGFRLSQYAEKGKLVISAEIAFILQEKKDVISNYRRKARYKADESIKIVDLKKLKGIWEGRKYPIIWFHLDWSSSPFEYDEYIESNYVYNIKKEQTLDHIKMSQVFEDIGKDSIVENMIETINQTRPEIEKDIINYNVPKERLAEIHCAAICFNEKKRDIDSKKKKR